MVSSPGIARIDINQDGTGCRKVWTNNKVRAASVVPRATARNGLIYTFENVKDAAGRRGPVVLDRARLRTRARWCVKQMAGYGGLYNNHYAGIAIGRNATTKKTTLYLGGSRRDHGPQGREVIASRASVEHRRPRALVAPALGLAAALALTALLPAAAPAAKTTVFINGDSISNYKFTPPTVTIRRKQAVQWTWDSNAPHNVKFPKTGKTSVTGASETYKLKFKRRGTFKYLCTIHDFHGKVIVKK